MFAMLFQCDDGLAILFFEVDEILQVDGSLLAFLELPCDILRPRIRMPLLQVLFTQRSVWVVICAEKVDTLGCGHFLVKLNYSITGITRLL